MALESVILHLHGLFHPLFGRMAMNMPSHSFRIVTVPALKCLAWNGLDIPGHFKAVKCAEVWPTLDLEANGLNQSNFEEGVPQGVLPDESDNHLNLWNEFSDVKSYHEEFYPEDTCHVGPCPGDGTPPDAIVEDDESSLVLIKGSRLLGSSSWLRGFW